LENYKEEGEPDKVDRLAQHVNLGQGVLGHNTTEKEDERFG
jgi:hypothetical protein